jgi:hypothetical protein
LVVRFVAEQVGGGRVAAGPWSPAPSLLVRGASKLALSFGMSPLVVGLTIVAFGTSAPEMAVSVGAVLDGQTDIAVGNVVGSNIFNVLFILGLSALITPLVVHMQLIRQEVPIMIGAPRCCCWCWPWTAGGADHVLLAAWTAASPSTARCCSPCCWPTPCSWSCSRASETKAANDEYAPR